MFAASVSAQRASTPGMRGMRTVTSGARLR